MRPLLGAPVLSRIRAMASARARHRAEVKRCSSALRALAVSARDEGATVDEIAKAMGISRQGVYSFMRGSKNGGNE